jgi:hypothetical protein
VVPKPAEDRRDSAPPETHIAEIERAVSVLPAEALDRLARLYFTPSAIRRRRLDERNQLIRDLAGEMLLVSGARSGRELGKAVAEALAHYAAHAWCGDRERSAPRNQSHSRLFRILQLGLGDYPGQVHCRRILRGGSRIPPAMIQAQIWSASWQLPPGSMPPKPSRAGESAAPHRDRNMTQIAWPGTGPALDPETSPAMVMSREKARRRRIPQTPLPSRVPLSSRRPRHDPPPPADNGRRLVAILRPGVTLADGSWCAIGDRVALGGDDAARLVQSGAADFVAETAP